MTYGPIARVALRYIVGAAIMGSPVIGEELAADPDLVAVLALAIGAAVEVFYVMAKRNGWST